MKKLVFISLISILMVGSGASAAVVHNKDFYDDNSLESVEQEFFENGTISSPKNRAKIEGETDYFGGDSFMEYDPTAGGDMPSLRGMPVFKKYRIKMTNYFKIKAHERELKDIEEQKKILNEMDESEMDIDDFDYDDLKERNLKKIYKDEDGNEVEVSNFQKFKNLFKRKNKETSEISDKKQPAESEASEDSDGETKELSGGVKEVVAQKDIILDCDKLDYDDENAELYASGHPVLSFPPQGVTIKADKLTYNTESNIIKAYGNVEIIKDGSPIYGDYVQINMNDESALVTNMKADKMNMLINAKNVVAAEDTIELLDGSMTGDRHYILALRSNMMGPRLENMIIPDEEKSKLTKDGLEIKVNAEEIYVTAKKDHDIVTVKNSDVYYKDNHLFRFGSFTAHTNKNHEYFEANYPEFGTIPRLGMFIGPGFVFDVPNGGSAKFIPFLNYKNEFGVGAALKYRSGTNYTEMYYGSAEDMFILKGRQYLDDNLYMLYGINSYLEDWFMGSGMSKYRLEAVYRDSVTIPNTLYEGLHAKYRQRISAGYVQDSDYNRNNENISSSEMGTTRFKYMAELSQTLFKYRSKKELLSANLSWIFQGSAALYGTGDTQFVGRMGPALHTQYKYWMQDIGYFLSAFDDQTPVPRFDMYRYGRSNVYLRESLRVNKYLTVSWMGSATLSDDSPNGRLIQENGFYFSIGPDDLKVTLGYDFIRERTFFTFTTALDLKGTQVNYKKMVIKNPDRLARDDSEKVEPISFDKPSAQKVKRTHAEVIEIEDPDREQL